MSDKKNEDSPLWTKVIFFRWMKMKTRMMMMINAWQMVDNEDYDEDDN